MPGITKSKIHPKYSKTTIRCVCGNVIETRSTIGGEVKIEICSNCHPFFTGKQKLVDTAGRVERFRRKYGMEKGESKPAAAEAPAEGEEPKQAEPTAKRIAVQAIVGCSSVVRAAMASADGMRSVGRLAAATVIPYSCMS